MLLLSMFNPSANIQQSRAIIPYELTYILFNLSIYEQKHMHNHHISFKSRAAYRAIPNSGSSCEN
ncbi:hypothetical protein HanRHA438_Chr12g0545821 [Helianthus annuus]|nr:hypothetical protein HanRHA438_Chr12g0545821 [Helianthus annuus]